MDFNHSYYHNDNLWLYYGDVLSQLKYIPDESIDCIVTSPPYWTQRSYGRLPNEIGLEKSPEEYIENLVNIFKELKKKIKKSGTFYLNIEDVYYGSGHGKADDLKGSKQGTIKGIGDKNIRSFFNKQRNLPHPFLKKKDLCLIPFRLIDKLQKDGWWIRSCIIWHKPNAMPENVKDRPTNDYEFVFLLTKSAKYYFKPILEKYNKPLNRWGGNNLVAKGKSFWDKETSQKTYRNRNMRPNPKGRNFRTIWSINTQPTHWEHPAKFPEELCYRAIKSGCPEGGIVLDPFMGSGTTGVVARKLNRKFIGIELSQSYCDMAIKRLEKEMTLL